MSWDREVLDILGPMDFTRVVFKKTGQKVLELQYSVCPDWDDPGQEARDCYTDMLWEIDHLVKQYNLDPEDFWSDNDTLTFDLVEGNNTMRVFEMVGLTDDGFHSNIIGRFATQEVLDAYIEKYHPGWEEGRAYTINQYPVYTSLSDVELEKRQKALAKLTTEEKKLLGLE